jgi:hypothetical protein
MNVKPFDNSNTQFASVLKVYKREKKYYVHKRRDRADKAN